MTQFEIIMRTDTPELPAEIGNFDEVMEVLNAALKEYSTDAIVTADNVKDAEKTRAHLRKVKDQIETYRKDAKAAYLAKFEKLEAQCKELSGLIEKPIIAIDGKIKEFENAENEKKWTELNLYFCSLNPPKWLYLADVVNPKWKNKTATIAMLKSGIAAGVQGFTTEFQELENLYGESDLWTAISNRYMDTKSKSQTLVYAAQLERQHAEEQKRAEEIKRQREAAEAARVSDLAEQQAAAPAAAPEAEAMPERMICGTFRVTGTKEQIKALAAFLKQTGIRYEVVK